MIRCASLALLLLTLLAACGGAPAAPTPTLAPTPADPAAPPTSAPADSAPAAPTSAPAIAGALTIGALSTYAHPSGIFSIGIPQGWEVSDRSSDGNLFLIWSAPDQLGQIYVALTQGSEPLSEAALIELGQGYVTGVFGDEQQFMVAEPQPQPDGSILLAARYLGKRPGGDIELRTLVFIEQRGDTLSLLTLTVPEAQADELAASGLREIATSYRINPDVRIS